MWSGVRWARGRVGRGRGASRPLEGGGLRDDLPASPPPAPRPSPPPGRRCPPPAGPRWRRGGCWGRGRGVPGWRGVAWRGARRGVWEHCPPACLLPLLGAPRLALGPPGHPPGPDSWPAPAPTLRHGPHSPVQAPPRGTPHLDIASGPAAARQVWRVLPPVLRVRGGAQCGGGRAAGRRWVAGQAGRLSCCTTLPFARLQQSPSPAHYLKASQP